MKIVFHSFIIAALVLGACTQRDKKGKTLDTPTSGSITIAIDESLKPLLDAELDTFHRLYVNAHIKVIYTSEADAMTKLLQDTARMVIVTRKLRSEEMETFKALTIKPHQVTVAKEGIALILNRAVQDTSFTISQIKDILTGRITKWNQLDPKAKASPIEVVFDQPTSGILRYLKDSLQIDSLPANCFAVQNNPAVVDYVSKKENAIGLIGVSWISDEDDSTTNAFTNAIRIAELSNDGAEYFQPYQAYIAQKQYPLVREITMIGRETRTGLASGFIAFVAGEKGQRIVLKAGLVPVTMPIRIVEINRQPLF
ncbi:MAG TPA: substrate-binding domain-containing protein [Ohtaekwangia sp.]|uniref:PstS family phosphate ABC transporter substrate-binding protein n=1 Tax=Ohtaekwangia sp. TaxID=2066019 RepID=UPI002F92C7D2